MLPKTLKGLSSAWIDAKEIERQAVEKRRSIEDAMKVMMEIDDMNDTTTTKRIEDIRIKVTTRLNRKINSEKLQDLAAESGLSEYLPTLFRWKPEINMSVWKKTDSSITDKLLDAVTTVPSRPSFNIINEDEGE
jgi:hypothetical protein